MFQKLVAIEPVSLVPSAEKALYSFAGQVVMYPCLLYTSSGLYLSGIPSRQL